MLAHALMLIAKHEVLIVLGMDDKLQGIKTWSLLQGMDDKLNNCHACQFFDIGFLGFG